MEKTQVRQMNKKQILFFWGVVALIGIFIVAYVYFVNIMIFNTANRKVTEESILEVKSEISELEFVFLEKTKNLTKDFAYSIGFQDVNEVVFVQNNPDNVSLGSR